MCLSRNNPSGRALDLEVLTFLVTQIAGSHVGAMSWAFLESMKQFGTRQSYIQVLQNTRQILKGRYEQVPQLSVGYEQDLNYQIRI